MIQLIVDGMELPESKKGGYKVAVEDLSIDFTMISGRLVRELRGSVYVVNYQYGFFNDDDKNRLLAILNRGKSQPISCHFLLPDSNELTHADCIVTAIKLPVFRWSRVVGDDGEDVVKPVWADFSFELREVVPHG